MGHRTILCSYCNKPLQVTDEKANQITCPICNKETVVTSLSFTVEELDFYAIKKPYSYISILKEKDSLKKKYVVLEPILSEEDTNILSFLREKILKSLNVRLDELEDAESYLIKSIETILDKYDITIDGISWEKIFYYIKKQFLGYDNIDPLMNDPSIEDISCDGAKVPMFVYQREFGSLETNIIFSKEKNLSNFVVKLAQKCGKHISVSDPMLDATMPDGSRIQMTLSGEVTTRGSTFTIRKFRADPITPIDLVDFETFSTKMIAYLWMAVERGFNALISGGTASGKTSVLNALGLFIPRDSKIVSIEETREINLPHPNWIPGVTRSGFGEVVNDRMVGEIDLFDLMKAALRQRPEYIMVGEIRGKEAYVLFQAMATGHTTYSTVHADSTQALIHRLEGKPINIPRTMLQSLDIVLLMRNQKTQDKNQRRCMKIVELLNIDSETKEVLTNTVFEWNPQENLFSFSGKSYILEQIRTQLDMSANDMSQEIQQRVDILSWLRKYHIREFTDVTKILAKYAETPEKVQEIILNEPEKIDAEIKDELSINEPEYDSLLSIPKVKKRNIISQDIKQNKKEKKNPLLSLFSADKSKKKQRSLKNEKVTQSSKKSLAKKKIYFTAKLKEKLTIKKRKDNKSFLNLHKDKEKTPKVSNPAVYYTTSKKMGKQDQKHRMKNTETVEKEIDEIIGAHHNSEQTKDTTKPDKTISKDEKQKEKKK
ncbi:MAG: type II/IV secretion system ATPase subunit [Candidatus Thermoplasmatota archaeon]|nr:type II/IV secretion system ATPase subunit [Candidatus Thermoplasmatota archaeon]